jgi:uncharacterized protein (TIGR02246 family)
MTITIATDLAPTPTEVATALVEHLERSWNRADGAGFAEVFAADSDFVDIRGVHHRGGDAIAGGHQAIFDSIYRASTVRYELDRARQVTPCCIVAVVHATLEAPDGPLKGTNHARFTLTITGDAERWTIDAFQNTLLPPTD